MEISKEQRSELLGEVIDFFQSKYGRLNFADRLRLVACFDFILKRIGEKYRNELLFKGLNFAEKS